MAHPKPVASSPNPIRPQHAALTRPAIRLALLGTFALLTLGVTLAPAATPGANTAYAATGPAPTLNQALQPPLDRTELTPIFRQAATTYNVPYDLLLAIGYVESRWTNSQQEPSEIPNYGIMGLKLPPAGDSLRVAAGLLGKSEDQLKFDAADNINGAAALLRSLADAQINSGANLRVSVAEDWYKVVAAYGGMPDPVVARSYAYSVFQVLGQGADATTKAGEHIAIARRGLLALPDRRDPLLDSATSADYPAAHWVAANANNFQVNRDYGPMSFIVIHDTEGTYQSAISWFQNAASGVSAHYVIRSSDGDVTQMVRQADTAYHAGNWDYNTRAIGIEHEGYMSDPTRWYSGAMYDRSVDLVRMLADQYGIKKDHAHIIGHYQVPDQRAPAHVDPGPGWDWAGFLAKVRRDSTVSARVDNSDSGFLAGGSGWQSFGGGYNSSNALMATSTTGNVTNSGAWSTGLPAAGAYDLYAYIPWVDNHNKETSSARYTVSTSSGDIQVTTSQKDITDAGDGKGEWMHLGRFNFGATARVLLTNQAGDSGKNVWFDAMMWIPATPGLPTPTPVVATATATNTPVVAATATNTAPPAATNTPLPTSTPTPTNVPVATATPGPCGMSFSDLPAADWAYTYVGTLYCRGIIGGYGDGSFRPGNPATRSQLAKMLVLASGWPLVRRTTPTFYDVPAENPFFLFVETAVEHQVISGYADGSFKPFLTVTRSQFSKMVVQAKGWWLVVPPTATFYDVAPDSWAYGFVETARVHNIISGYSDGSFRPGAETTRAQIAKLLALSFPTQ